MRWFLQKRVNDTWIFYVKFVKKIFCFKDSKINFNYRIFLTQQKKLETVVELVLVRENLSYGLKLKDKVFFAIFVGVKKIFLSRFLFVNDVAKKCCKKKYF